MSGHVKSPGIWRVLTACGLLLAARLAAADLEFVVKGIEDPLRANVLSYIDTVQIGRSVRASRRDREKVLAGAIDEARVALRPYGYYAPHVSGRYIMNRDRDPVLELTIRPGPPMTISALELRVNGAGSGRRELRAWREDWPLTVGKRLDQVVWERQKQLGIEIAEAAGLLNARYTSHALELDLEENTAVVRLVMETGEQFLMGDIDFGPHSLRPHVVRNIPRFEKGDPYSARLMDTFRLDLWQTGYFTDVDVIEVPRRESDPPAVDLELLLKTSTKNQYLGALGFGTDTGIRLQGNWKRQPMSSRGDSLDIGIGWQEVYEEFALRGAYRVPRFDRAREYWTADLTIKFENQDLEFKRRDEDEGFIKIANGNVDERHFRFGPLRIINSKAGDRQIFVTPFVQYLNSDRRFAPVEPRPTVIGGSGSEAFDRLLRGIDNALSAGVDLDVVSIRGKGFDTRGHRERAWIFTSNTALGSEFDFSQAYLATRRSFIVGDRWKLLLRAEVGYTDAIVDKVAVDIDGTPLELSVTRLPSFYRFRAGGGASVRGYAFEQLSNNNVGSNHIATASAEIEFRALDNWSAAVFADIGNAFNDWADPQLKLGIGFGVRWYSIAGPIRVDFARAMDFGGKPWRLHFTIGTPLL